ncbi:hypothetical protein BC332_28897 [Capsicum chinense]|nr:hypothetical protein BC332_28897 [Capsicum chinense]
MSLLYKRYLNQEQKIMITGRDDPNSNSPSVEELVKTFSIDSYPMKMVYDLLKRRFIYENKDKMDEVWINYCGIPVYFGWEEFAIVTGLKYFSPDFAASSKCSSCKCQDCKKKHNEVINAINALTASVKEITSKRDVIPSKKISYPDTPIEIKATKRGRKDTSKASSIIKKARFQFLCLYLASMFNVQGPQKSSMS